MDPITCAANAFLAELDAFFRKHPTEPAPLHTDPSTRHEMVQALRLAEHAPENRRPLFLYEARFNESGAYFDDLAQAIASQYAQIRGGAAEEGVVLPAFAPRAAGLSPLERAIGAGTQAAELLGEPLHGILLALVPEQIASPPAWRQSVVALSRLPRATRLRLAVYSPSGGDLGMPPQSRGARFFLDPPRLFAYLKDQDAAGSSGPARSVDPLHPGLFTEPPSSHQRTATLRALLLDAAEESATGSPLLAAAHYRSARARCADAGLGREEAIVLLGLAGVCLRVDHPSLAVEAYLQAAELATEHEAWQVVCQARLGLGGVHLTRKAYELAATAYQTAAEVAGRAALPLLCAEALRMNQVCLELCATQPEQSLATDRDALTCSRQT